MYVQRVYYQGSKLVCVHTSVCVCMCFDYCCIFKGVNIGYRFESEVVRGDDLCEDVEKLDCT